jgi:hypothetical protein
MYIADGRKSQGRGFLSLGGTHAHEAAAICPKANPASGCGGRGGCSSFATRRPANLHRQPDENYVREVETEIPV